MKNKKNLNNLGFTVFEMLVVVAIIGVIASMAIPITIVNQKKYNKFMFEQKCMLYEKVFIDTYEKYKYEFYGTTPLTKKMKFQIPFIFEGYTQEEGFVDILDPTYVYYFIYESLYKSEFSCDNHLIDYTPATITRAGTFNPSYLRITIDNDITIEIKLLNFVSSAGSLQSSTIEKVVISQDNLKYEFEV